MTTEESPLRISVAMATYNGAAHIREQLDSIARQTVLPDELVISDDGSTDDTLAIIRGVAADLPFDVRLLPPGERLGFADNFLRGAEACRGTLIAFADQDDVWLPTKLEVGRRRIVDDGSLLAMHRLLATDANLVPRGLWTQGIERDAVFEPTALDPYKNGWGNSMLFRRELLNVVARDQRPRQPESPERPLSHDTWIYVLAAALGRVSHIAEPLILYRQHGTNAMGIAEPGRAGPFGRQIERTRLLRERRQFYQRMRDLFGDVTTRRGDPFGLAAQRASRRYAERARPLERRCEIYDAPTFRARLRSYAALRREAALGTRTTIRHLLLGVSGLERALLRTPSKPAAALRANPAST